MPAGEKRPRNSSSELSDGEVNSFYRKPLKMIASEAKQSDTIQMESVHEKPGLGESKPVKFEMKDLIFEIRQMRTEFRESINSLRAEINQNLDIKFNQLNDRIDLEIGHMVARIDSVDQRMLKLESQTKNKGREPFDPEVTVVVFGLNETKEENIQSVAEKLIRDGLGLFDIIVVRAVRLGSRDGRPGVVKIEFCSPEEKIGVLKSKLRLSGSKEYPRVYIKQSHSHVERVLERNMKTILAELPKGNEYRITSHGIVVKKNSLPLSVHNNRKENTNLRQIPVASNRPIVPNVSQHNSSVRPKILQQSPIVSPPSMIGFSYNPQAPVFSPPSQQMIMQNRMQRPPQTNVPIQQELRGQVLTTLSGGPSQPAMQVQSPTGPHCSSAPMNMHIASHNE